jgi:hypothetical protein
MGLVWNLPGKWPSHITTLMIPHLLKALQLATNYKRTNTALGAFLIAMPNVSSENVDYMLENNAIDLLLELKEKPYMKDEAENRLWKAFVCLGKYPKGQKMLTNLISKNPPKSHLSESDRIKIARALTIQQTVDPLLFECVKSLLMKVAKPEAFFYLMDAVVHLCQNTFINQSSSKVDELSSILLTRLTYFQQFSLVANWSGWAKMSIGKNELPADSKTKVYMDPRKSVGVHVASNGLLCRHSFANVFGTTVASHCAKRGKWYFEVTVYSQGLCQVGWATDHFYPTPQGGNGVGDDRNSWAIDLKRHAKWHDGDRGSLCQPYGDGVNLLPNGVIGCYLDLEQKIMRYTYNAQDLGVAFDDFSIEEGFYPALSMNLENECLLNFGTDDKHPFEYPPKDYLPYGSVAYLQ